MLLEAVGRIDELGTSYSFYQVHWYEYPIMDVLELFTDFYCVEKGSLDVGYMSELDPTWNDDNLALILNPDALFFNGKSAQLACVADCMEANFKASDDKLFWCAGCQGSLYPFTGTVGHHLSGLQASSLLVNRLIAKLHRTGFVKGFKEDDFCEAKYMPIIKKSLYKTQIAYPVAQKSGECHALGKSDLLWGTGKSYPFGGEDFVYVLWIKKQCCLDAGKASASASASGAKL